MNTKEHSANLTTCQERTTNNPQKHTNSTLRLALQSENPNQELNTTRTTTTLELVHDRAHPVANTGTR